MGFKSKKLISRDESGHWVRNDITDEGSHSPKELQSRAEAAEQQLKDAIARDSSDGMVKGDTLQHPATDSAVARLKADRDRENAETNAKESDKPELTPRKTKRT